MRHPGRRWRCLIGVIPLLWLVGLSSAAQAKGEAGSDAKLIVTIQGVSTEQEVNIRALLSVQPLHEKTISSRTRLRFLHNKAVAEIRKALQPFGYYKPVINAQLVDSDKGLEARYLIDPGPVLPIGRLDIQLAGEAARDPVFKQLIQKSPLREGAPFLHRDYETLKQQLNSLAAERGYYHAALIQRRVEVDLARYQADIALHFDSGPRFHVGDIRFSDTPLNQDFLLRYVPFQRGEPLQSSVLLDLQTALIDSDYFQRVEVRPLWDQAGESEVPIDIALDAHKRTRYRTGFGYGTDTGPRAKLGMTRRWVNKRGHQFNSQLLASQIKRSFSAEYAIPGRKPQQDRYAVRLGVSDENSESIDALNRSLGVSWQQQQGRWQRILALDWQQEIFSFSGQEQRSEFLIPRISFNRVSTKNRLDVRSGHRLSFQLLGASDRLLSDTNVVQATLSAKRVHSLSPKIRLIGRGEAGVTVVDHFDKLPATLRYFAGGDASVRGYAYQSLGPKDQDNAVVGGPYLLTGSVEIDYRLGEKWGVAAFADSGSAFENRHINLHNGVGIGARWFSPIGPIRLDIAAPLDKDKDGLRVHFSLGPDL